MHDEVDPFCRRHANLEDAPCGVGTDEHDQIPHIEYPNRVVVGMHHVFVAHPVPACARQDRWIHPVNLY